MSRTVYPLCLPLSLAFTALLAACPGSHVGSPIERDSSRAVHGEGSASVADNERVAPRTPPPDASRTNAPSRGDTGGRIVYDFLAHLDHAEQRVDDHLYVDFGVPADAKFTLGGWGTRVRSRVLVDGVTASLVQGNYGDVSFSVSPEAHTPHLHVRVRCPRDGDLTLFVDDKQLKHVVLDRNAFATVSVALPPELATAGEHSLRLRATGMAPVGKESTGVAIDWLALNDAETPPVPPAALSSGPTHVEPTTTLAFLVPVQAASSLVVRAQGGADAAIDVSVVREDGKREKLGRVAVSQVDSVLSLRAYAGEVVRIEFGAGSPVQLARAAVLEASSAARVAAKPPKNVLVYLIDTLRADHLKPFNPHTRVRAPGLDALVALGSAFFTSAHTQENWTKPSVATLLSSLYPWEHHAVTTEAVVPEEVQFLPERLAALGFYRGAFIANGYVSDKFGFKQGWSTYRNYIREGRYSRAEFLAADVVEWLDKRPPEKPFFLYVHAIDPHVPYKPTAKFLSVYDPDPYAGVVDFSRDNELLEKIKLGKIKLNPRDKTHLEALYDSEISYHDVHFHAIMEALARRDLSDDTMIVVVADHGEEFWDHGSVGHGHSVYEELIRIPMVVRVPGLTESSAIHTSAGLVDIVPTVFDALGQPRPDGLSGRSLMPELRGAALDAPPSAVSGFMDGVRSIVVGKHKLIQRSEKRFTMYDLEADPSEQHDVARTRPLATRFLRAQLGLKLAAVDTLQSARPRAAIKAQTTRIDAETEAQLRALGYVDGSRR